MKLPQVLRTPEDYLGAILVTLRRQNQPHSGKTWGCQPVLKKIEPAMELYFVTRYSSSIVLPKGQMIYIPRQVFRKLILLNEGNCDIMFDTNYKPGDQQQSSVLRAQEDIQIDATGPEPIWSFSAKAIAPGGPTPDIGTQQNLWGGDLTTAHLRILAIT